MSDIYSANTRLLLHMEGSNDSTIFTDSSNFSVVATAYGNAKISTAQSKFGSGSGYFDGSGDYLLLGASLLSSGDWTVEGWVYLLGVSAAGYMYAQYHTTDDNTKRTIFGVNSNRYPFFQLGSTVLLGSAAVALNTWAHLAFTRVGNTVTCYLDGVSGGTVTVSGNMSTVIGSISAGWTNGSYSQGFVNGYIQDLRVTVGVSRYNATFTPPGRLDDPDPFGVVLYPDLHRSDYYDGGRYRIIGTVTELGVAGPYRVRLFDRQSARCVRETWSNASGAYAFNNLAYRANGYFAVAYDHGDNPLNAAIADLITPELMS